MSFAVRGRLKRLRRLDCCAVSDALDSLGLPAVVANVPQQSGSTRICGIILTVELGTGDASPGPPRHLGTTAIEAGGPEHVIVIQQTTGIDAGSWGGLLTLAAKLRGIAGVIADGPVRDIEEARACDFPIFARALTARTARGRIVEKATNVPVTVWSVTVNPRDYVLADHSAIAFIGAAHIDRVLDAAEAIAAREAAMAHALLAGTPVTEVMSADYERLIEDPAE